MNRLSLPMEYAPIARHIHAAHLEHTVRVAALIAEGLARIPRVWAAAHTRLAPTGNLAIRFISSVRNRSWSRT